MIVKNIGLVYEKLSTILGKNKRIVNKSGEYFIYNESVKKLVSMN